MKKVFVTIGCEKQLSEEAWNDLIHVIHFKIPQSSVVASWDDNYSGMPGACIELSIKDSDTEARIRANLGEILDEGKAVWMEWNEVPERLTL